MCKPYARYTHVPSRKCWAMPVDIAKLGAVLQAKEQCGEQIATIKVLRARPNSLFNRVPGEIFDEFIDAIIDQVVHQYEPKWLQLLRCFQGRCRPMDHLVGNDPLTLRTWDSLSESHPDFVHLHPEGSITLNMEERRKIMSAYFEDNPKLKIAHTLGCWHSHHALVEKEWLETTCLNSPTGLFKRYNNILRVNSGAELAIAHYKTSQDLGDCLPDHARDCQCGEFTYIFPGYPKHNNTCGNTLCFLVLVSPQEKPVCNRGEAPTRWVDLGRLLHSSHSDEFNRLRRSLRLKPHFNIHNLEYVSARLVSDPTWRPDFYDAAALGNPLFSLRQKVQLFEEYIEKKERVLDSQEWPQWIDLSVPVVPLRV